MSIKESALSAITSIAQSDFVRAVTSAGASRRVTVANLAKAIIESYTGSSLAGSNQSVKSAIDSIGSISFTNSQVTANVEKTITIPSNYRGALWLFDSYTARCGHYIVFSTGAGSVTLVPVLAASGLTISTDTNAIKITTEGNTRLVFMNANGKVTP